MALWTVGWAGMLRISRGGIGEFPFAGPRQWKLRGPRAASQLLLVRSTVMSDPSINHLEFPVGLCAELRLTWVEVSRSVL